MTPLWWTFWAAWRSLRRVPGLACTAALLLGLGIGAVTAMFTVVDHVFCGRCRTPMPTGSSA